MESEILNFICANTGAVDVDDLMSDCFKGQSTSDIISNHRNFVLYSSDGKQKVVARTSLKLCKVETCQGFCGGLHLCKSFLFNELCHLLDRGGCSLSHDLNSDHCQRVLKQHELEGLSREELCTLLMQSDDTLLPSICHDYSVGDGKFGQCQKTINCRRLHICEKFHKEALRCPGNPISAANTEAKADDGQNLEQRPADSEMGTDGYKDKTQICMYFIQGYCKHGDQCSKAHDKMPYRWQVQEGDRWTNLPGNEAIEEEYCDPNNNSSSGNPPIFFDTMTCGQNKVRRLSTPTSLDEPDFIHATGRLWYWQDEFGQWNLYGANDDGCKPADIDSEYLEKQLGCTEVVEFTAGSHSYLLSFQDMMQTNKQYGTKKLVKTRPRFVSAADVQAKNERPINSTNVPDNWDKTQISRTGFSRIALSHTSDEFKNIQALFQRTMKGSKIFSIARIQNKALWEFFQGQKNLMKDKNGGRNVTERQLFHGTDSKHVDAICLNNFDWRICGVHGTLYGKGSYFARDAAYSHKYTGDTIVKTMFISRVLVGSYTKGASSYVRPPSKDGGNMNFYDSCVNDVTNPSVFVVFEKHQIYPEYLLKYSELNFADVLSAQQAPKPTIQLVPAPKLPTSPQQSSTFSTQPNKPAHQPSSSNNINNAQLSDQNSKTSPQGKATLQRSKSLSDLNRKSRSKKTDRCVVM
ncbi:protein mono-ADP-ribosyltransferase PARP12 isoform X2 [Kryptolebias marmoratus]|uniref:protein mono-ADP-ribosyltransferase PARP12 isoform X2 n=1 Tax=Kryptolebias marmoratus TaxID=37003 RepID=UPI000D530192|nr:protein mono-ADP-ribosyltransferase PARP12 isoform X2 [Kryptolebias marmoratus]